jgi:hypothetical protein
MAELLDERRVKSIRRETAPTDPKGLVIVVDAYGEPQGIATYPATYPTAVDPFGLPCHAPSLLSPDSERHAERAAFQERAEALFASGTRLLGKREARTIFAKLAADQGATSPGRPKRSAFSEKEEGLLAAYDQRVTRLQHGGRVNMAALARDVWIDRGRPTMTGCKAIQVQLSRLLHRRQAREQDRLAEELKREYLARFCGTLKAWAQGMRSDDMPSIFYASFLRVLYFI